MRSAIYTGTLMHARREPARNVFRYPVAYFLLDLDELEQRRLDGAAERGRWRLRRRLPGSTLPGVAVNRRGLVQFRDADHFDGRPVKQAVLELAGDSDIERVLCLTQLRVFGYVFNPVSFYWCSGRDGSLSCVLAELNNTFGERLVEVLRGPELRYEHAKRLHVSPFNGLDQTYEWAFSEPRDEVWARVHVREGAARPLTAVLHGRRRELTRRSLAGTLLRYPLMPLQVIALIHLQALRLWLKRVPFHHKPPFVPGEGSVR